MLFQWAAGGRDDPANGPAQRDKRITLSSETAGAGGAAVMDALGSFVRHRALRAVSLRPMRQAPVPMRRRRSLPAGQHRLSGRGARGCARVLIQRPGDLVTKDEILRAALAGHGGRGRQSHGADLGAASDPSMRIGGRKLSPDRVGERLPIRPSPGPAPEENLPAAMR